MGSVPKIWDGGRGDLFRSAVRIDGRSERPELLVLLGSEVFVERIVKLLFYLPSPDETNYSRSLRWLVN